MSEDAGALVKLAAAAGVATITLARPGMRNALVPELLLDLCVALETAGRRDDVRCVLLQAEGDAFSVGEDLRRLALEMQGPRLQAYSAELVGLLNQAVLSLLRLAQPVVASVQGEVAGGSIGLVLAADVVIAADTARFRAHPAGAGFSPDGGWTALLPRLAGARRAGAGLLLNRAIGAHEARDWGIVTDVVPAAGLREAAAEAARAIAAAPAAPMRNAKRMLVDGLERVEAALESERMRFIDAIDGAEAREAVARLLRAAPRYPAEGGDVPAGALAHAEPRA